MLVEWLREHSTNDRVIHNAAHTGRIENYGVFCSAPGSTSAGWVLAITTPQARYRVVVIENELHEWVRWYRIRPTQIDWSAWVGDQFHAEIYRGDQPEVYDGCRKAAVTAQQLSRSGAEGADSNLPPETHGRAGDEAADRQVDRQG
jgi:hypothetical protein